MAKPVKHKRAHRDDPVSVVDAPNMEGAIDPTTGSRHIVMETLAVAGASMFGASVGLNFANAYAAFPDKALGVALGAAIMAGLTDANWHITNTTSVAGGEDNNSLLSLLKFSPMAAARVGLLAALVYKYTHTADTHMQAMVSGWTAGLSQMFMPMDSIQKHM